MKASQGLDADKLKHDLLISYLMLSLLGIVLLLLGLFATLEMRDSALKLLEESAPRVEASDQLQKGLERSISTLRAWMANADMRYQIENQTTWKKDIYSALDTLLDLDRNNGIRNNELLSIKEQLKALELWQWHIKDVVHTPGNFPGQWTFDSKIAVILPDIILATEALVDLEIQKGESSQNVNIQQIIRFKSATFRAISYLQRFVNEGLVYQKNGYFEELNKADLTYQKLLSLKSSFSQDQKDQIGILEQSLGALKYFAAKAITDRESDTHNVANFWLNQICLPAVEDLNSSINRLTDEERLRMQSDAETIHWIATWVPRLMVSLLLVMIFVSIFFARKRTKQFIQPVLLLRKQDQLKSDLTELTSCSHGVSKLQALCESCLNYIALHVNASAGALYVHNKYVLRLTAGYALPKKMLDELTLINPGEGLVGQVFKNKRAMVFSDTESLVIKSSLLDFQPSQIIIAPIIHEEQVLAVMELASLTTFTTYQREFIELGLQQLGMLFNDVSQKETIKEALTVSQAQAEELQAQAEELQAQTEELQAQTEELQVQGEELRVTNEDLSNKGVLLESQKQAIQQQVRELEESGRYKSEFLANMSHELRTPLNSLLLLAKGLADNKKAHLDNTEVEDAQIIYESGNSLLALINDILDLSKVEAGKLSIHIENIRMETLKRNLSNIFNPIAKKRGLEFQIHIADNVPDIFSSDGQRLEQILRNLLSNAMKFTMTGTVSLTISMAKNDIGLKHNGLLLGEIIDFSVIDTGIGIPKEKQQAIFEAFQQQDGSTSRKYGGTGLGLTIAKELTRLLGGEIKLFSSSGEGSRFSVYLAKQFSNKPLDEPQLSIPKTQYEYQEDSFEANPVIQVSPDYISDDRRDLNPDDKVLLVVDDDKKFARILRDCARDNGYKCLVAGDGRSGVYLAKSYQPNGIILDIGLPDIDGHQVLEQLKFSLKTRHIPVQVISAYDDSKKNILIQGAIGFLTKPVQEEQLHVVLGEIAEMISSDVKQILLIEDDKNNQQAAIRLLANSGINIHCAATGQEGCEEIQSGHYDCVILDLGLPDMSGFEVLKQINESQLTRIPPVIIYTGRDISDEEQAELDRYSSSIVIKGAGSSERLLDDVSLFLHNIDSHLKQESKQVIHLLHDEDAMLKDRKILLVDDDMRNTYALSKQLIEIGCDVEMANNGQEALDLLAMDSDYELILMDTMMPIMDGNEATIRIRQIRQYKNIPIIALTAKTMPEDRAKCLQAGASEYLTKPIDFDKLLSIMRIWLFKQS